MSYVTNILLSHGILEKREVKHAIRHLDLGRNQTFRSLTSQDEEASLGADGKARPGDFWGGGKWPECDLWACSGNHVDWRTMLEGLAALPWEYPNRVQVFIRDQEDDAFSVFMMHDGQFDCVLDRSEDSSTIWLRECPPGVPAKDLSGGACLVAGVATALCGCRREPFSFRQDFYYPPALA